MTHHSEPARETVAACPFCGGPARTFSMNGTTQATCAGKFTECAGFDVSAPVAMWNRRASPAPAAGGLEAVREAFKRWKDGYGFNEDSDADVELSERADTEIAALASPAATRRPTYVVNCCNCGRIIDTREESEGGDQWGHELSDDRWVCSPECLDAVTDPDAVPAATSAETQGGDGSDGTVAQRKEHAEPDEGRQDAGSTPAGSAASICDCEQAHNGLGISGRECDCQADDERCTGCYGTGWDSNAERFCHCEDGANAALAPSTSAATRGERVRGPVESDDGSDAWQSPAPTGRQERTAFESWAAKEWQNSTPPGNAWKGWVARAQVESHRPAPAVESAQVKGLCLPEEITPAIEDVFGIMIWTSGSLARAYRAGGFDIPTKAEAEQAFILWRMLRFAVEHGDQWRKIARDDLARIRASLDLATDAEG